MKKLLFLLFTIHCSLLTLFSQAPQSFNYQAVAWDDAGELMKSTSLTVRISIFSESETGTLQWKEAHSATTNEYGLFTIQIGAGTRTAGSANEFSDIDWGSFSHFIKVEVDPAGGTSYQDMGTTQLLSVPYALSARSVSSLKSLNIEEPTGHNPDSALFEVKNLEGNTVFAVYNEGVRIYVDDNPAKGAKGGFAVGGFKTGKGITNEYLWISPDSIRVYVDSSGAKGSKGGFAVGGFKTAKGANQEFLRITTDSVRIYVKDESAKGSKGGFAVGGFKAGKSDPAINFMHLTPDNYFIGHQAGSSMTTGLYNSFFGYQSGMSTTTGSRNVFSGYKAGYSNTDGWKNILIGSYAGFSNDSGNYNVFLGDLAGYENTTGVQNIYIGAEAGYSSTTGGYNVILGAGAGSDITEGVANVFIGNFAGHENDTSSWNVFVGNSAGQKNIGGKSNVFLGSSSGRANTEGDWNVMIGNLSGRYNEVGEKNVFIGAEAGYSNTSGNNNVFLGNLSGNKNTTGRYNVYLGRLAGYENEYGDFNVFIGNRAGQNETGSNKLYIENSSAGSTSALIYGDFLNDKLRFNANVGIGYNPLSSYGLVVKGGSVNSLRVYEDSGQTFALYVSGKAFASGRWWVPAAKGIKGNFSNYQNVIDRLRTLNSVLFEREIMNKSEEDVLEEKQIGLIGEEVLKAFPELVTKDQDGNIAIDYAGFSAVFIEAFKEQQAMIEALQLEIQDLKEKIE